MNALDRVDYMLPVKEAELFIWETDEDGDRKVNWYEFEMMYKRCIFDTTFLEPRYFCIYDLEIYLI